MASKPSFSSSPLASAAAASGCAAASGTAVGASTAPSKRPAVSSAMTPSTSLSTCSSRPSAYFYTHKGSGLEKVHLVVFLHFQVQWTAIGASSQIMKLVDIYIWWCRHRRPLRTTPQMEWSMLVCSANATATTSIHLTLSAPLIWDVYCRSHRKYESSE